MVADHDAELSRVRADVLLVEMGLAQSRARARALIEDGKVAGVSKAGQMIPEGRTLSLLEPDHQWVSRGGLKLDQAMDHFGLSPEGKVALDIGASTGGFTQVLLSRGAARVYAVDVGREQLHASLLDDPRVISLESTNSRDLTPEIIPDTPDAIVADVSFISLRVALPAALDLAAPGAWLLALVKPQFEVGRANIGKGGIVRDTDVRDAVPVELADWLSREMGWQYMDVIESPIEGSDGNREFLMAARKV